MTQLIVRYDAEWKDRLAAIARDVSAPAARRPTPSRLRVSVFGRCREGEGLMRG